MTIPFVLNGVVKEEGVFAATVQFTGQIVAVANVREPSTIILAALGGLALLAIKRHRFH